MSRPARARNGQTLTDRFDRALLYASQVHGGQLRKGTTIPYVAHLLGVASLVLEDGGDEDQAIAALLHDAVEDQGREARLADIRARFGPRVARIVQSCTNWSGDKDEYVEHLAKVPAETLRVSAADKLFNARAILRDYRSAGDPLWKRFKGGRDGTLRYYEGLVRVFTRRAPRSPVVQELERVVAELARLAGS